MEKAEQSGRRSRGFASMDKDRQRVIASKGGRAAHEKGTAHEFNSGEASLAAKRGHERGTAHEFTSEEARVAGRKGGLARAMNRTQRIRAGEDTEGGGSGLSVGTPENSVAIAMRASPESSPAERGPGTAG